MDNCCRKVLFCDAETVWRTVLMHCLSCGASFKNYCKKVLFCDMEPVRRTVSGRYCFDNRRQCGELLHEVIVL